MLFKHCTGRGVGLVLPVVRASVIGEVCSRVYMEQNNSIFTVLVSSISKDLSGGIPVPDVPLWFSRGMVLTVK